jgi:hypothetical protein
MAQRRRRGLFPKEYFVCARRTVAGAQRAVGRARRVAADAAYQGDGVLEYAQYYCLRGRHRVHIVHLTVLARSQPLESAGTSA